MSMLNYYKKTGKDLIPIFSTGVEQAKKGVIKTIAVWLAGKKLRLEYLNHGYYNEFTAIVLDVSPPSSDNLFDLKVKGGSTFRVWPETKMVVLA